LRHSLLIPCYRPALAALQQLFSAKKKINAIDRL
jgi:hypothetical protein